MADIVDQPIVLLWFVASGMVAGLLYALLRGFRRGFKGKGMTVLTDLVFCVCALGLFGVAMVFTVQRSVRWYTAAAFLAGIALFLLGPGGALSNTVQRLRQAAGKRARRLLAVLEEKRTTDDDEPGEQQG